MKPTLSDMISVLVAERLNVPQASIPLDEDFADLGLESLDAVILSGLLEEQIGCPVDPTLFIENRSVSAVARAMSDHIPDDVNVD